MQSPLLVDIITKRGGIFLNKIIVFSIGIVCLLATKGLSGITLIKDHWYAYLIGILFINLGWILSKSNSSFKKFANLSYLVAVVVILFTGVIRLGERTYYNYTYSPDYQHRLILKEVNSRQTKGDSILEIHEQFGVFKKKKDSIYIERVGSPLTIELPRKNGNVFKPLKEFQIGGVCFFWETNNILQVEWINAWAYSPEEEKLVKIRIILEPAKK